MSESASKSKTDAHPEAPSDSRAESEETISQGESGKDQTESTTPPTGRSRRALKEEMDVSLLRRGGLYEVRSASGKIYEVNVLEKSCTCPDFQENAPVGGCKHLRRVDYELQAGRLPRPDGKLPTGRPRIGCHSAGGSSNQHRNGTKAADSSDVDRTIHQRTAVEQSMVEAQLVSEMQQREEEIAQIDAELQALQFVSDVLDSLKAGRGFDLKRLQEDEAGPASGI